MARFSITGRGLNAAIRLRSSSLHALQAKDPSSQNSDATESPSSVPKSIYIKLEDAKDVNAIPVPDNAFGIFAPTLVDRSSVWLEAHRSRIVETHDKRD